jgi:putative flippase GtrA
VDLSPTGLWRWGHTHQGRTFLRYSATSVITTVISLGAVAGLYGFRVIHGVMWATLVGNLIGMIPAYNLNRRWAWGKRGRSALRTEVAPFFMMSALGIAFSQVGAFWARHEVHAHRWAHSVDTALVAGTNLACFAVFWILKLLVFNRIFHVHELAEFDRALTDEEMASNP